MLGSSPALSGTPRADNCWGAQRRLQLQVSKTGLPTPTLAQCTQLWQKQGEACLQFTAQCTKPPSKCSNRQPQLQAVCSPARNEVQTTRAGDLNPSGDSARPRRTLSDSQDPIGLIHQDPGTYSTHKASVPGRFKHLSGESVVVYI